MFLLCQRKTFGVLCRPKGDTAIGTISRTDTRRTALTERYRIRRFQAPYVRAWLPERSFCRRPAPADHSFAAHRIRATKHAGERRGSRNFDYSAFVGLEYTAIQPVKQPG
jgi:hypothetical protein